MHIGTILGVLLWAGGMVCLASTFSGGSASLLGKLAVAAVFIGAAVFIVDFVIDGVAGHDLAAAWTAADPAGKTDIELAAQTAFTALRGTSLISILILWGLPLMLFARALTHAAYPAWLTWSALAIGGLLVAGALALLFREDLFPGMLLYGVLVSLVMPLWSIALGAIMWRCAG